MIGLIVCLDNLIKEARACYPMTDPMIRLTTHLTLFMGRIMFCIMRVQSIKSPQCA